MAIKPIRNNHRKYLDLERKEKKLPKILLCFVIIYFIILIMVRLNADVTNVIYEHGSNYNVDIPLILAIGMTESGLKEKVKPRYELFLSKECDKNQWYLSILSAKEKTNDLCFASIGTMQILYGTAKECGYTGTPQELNELENNIKFSVIHIKDLIRRYVHYHKAIMCYNKGYCPNDFQKYIYYQTVKKWYIKFGGKVELE